MKKLLSQTTIYIVRHGESENNLKEVIGSDPELTKRGEIQAELIAKTLANVKFDFIFSSDLRRTINTAKVIAKNNNLKIRTSKKLRERNYGEYEGQPMEKFRADLKDILQKMKTMPDEQIKNYRRYEGFETDEELVSRFSLYLKRIVRLHQGKTILIATHGIVMRIFLVYLGFAKYKELPPFSIKNTGYIKVTSDGNNFYLNEVNGVKKMVTH